MRTIASTGSPLAPEGFDWVYSQVKADVHLASFSGGTDICGGFVIGQRVASGEGDTASADTRVVLFVKLRDGLTLDDELIARIRSQIRSGASPRHVPAVIAQVSAIPRTRSGKLVELAVRDAVEGRTVANVEAIDDPDALDCFADHPALGP